MRLTLRFALIAMLTVAFAMTTHGALAQNTDEAHARCSQGGGQATFSGAAEPNERGVEVPAAVRGFESIPHAPNTDDGASGGDGGGGGDQGGVGGAAIARALNPRGFGLESAAGSGGGGGEGGLGGTLVGGGAGGCSEGLAAPRRLPVTGGPVSVAIMGAAFIAVGGSFLGATRYLGRRFGFDLAR